MIPYCPIAWRVRGLCFIPCGHAYWLETLWRIDHDRR